MRKNLRKSMAFMLVLSCMLAPASTAGAAQKEKNQTVNQYFSESAFVGNSVSKGLKMYFDRQGKGFLGGPCMLVQGCYSFLNDKNQVHDYMITFKGKKYMAKDAIAKAKVKRVFISMGTNDLWKSSAQTYQDYVEYVEGIRKKNPKVVIFIQSTTPMVNSSQKKYLNNAAISDLNKRMKKYCKKQKDLYYVDINKNLADKNGSLKYASDGYVHMTMEGYRIWTDNLKSEVSKLLKQEQKAKDAVDTAKKKKTEKAYRKAKKLVKELDLSSKRQELNSVLKNKIKKTLKKEKKKHA